MNLSKASLRDVLACVRHSKILLSRIGIDLSDEEKILSDALAERKVDVNSVLPTLDILNGLDEQDIHWMLAPTKNFVNYIKAKYHNHHRIHLPKIIALAEQVECQNRDSLYCPVGLADYMKNMHKELLAHMESEEQILFPFLADEKQTYIFTQVSLAIHNHDHEIGQLTEVNELTNGLTLPENAGYVWETLYAELKDFKGELMEHVRLENDVLFRKVSGLSSMLHA
jgi:regulator of cell morphogenesis and NO signaling